MFGSSSHRDLRFTACGWFAIAMHLLLAFGTPIPLPADKDVSSPFPCMTRRCGCRSAQQCWTGCCCMTLAERIAWAKAHGVEVPEFVAQAEIAKAMKSCCAPRSCCATKRRACCTPSAAARRESSGQQTPVVMAEVLQCRGMGEYLFGAVIALPPPMVDTEVALVRCGDLEVIDCSRVPVADPPRVPPPRRDVEVSRFL